MSDQSSGPPTGPPTGPPGPPRGPTIMRDEYQNLTEEFVKDVKTKLKDIVDSLLLVGSVVTKEHIAGESDCDFLIILKDKAAEDENLEKSMEKISDVVLTYLEDPLYSSLLDVEVLTKEEIPKTGKPTDFPWTRVLVAQQGKALIGKNPFEGIKIQEEDIKESARDMAKMFLEDMEAIPTLEDVDDYDKRYLTVDAVLGCGCAYLYYQGETEFYRSSAIILLEDKYKDKLDITPFQTAHYLRLAAKSVNIEKFTENGLKFCKEVVKQLS